MLQQPETCAGSRPAVKKQRPGFPFELNEKGMVATDAVLRVPAHPRVFAIGDTAAAERDTSADDTVGPFPATAQVLTSGALRLICCLLFPAFTASANRLQSAQSLPQHCSQLITIIRHGHLTCCDIASACAAAGGAAAGGLRGLEHLGEHPRPPAAALQVPAPRHHDDSWICHRRRHPQRACAVTCAIASICVCRC